MENEVNALFSKIESEFDTLMENHQEFANKQNKAAGKRARKAANNLKKLLTPYKQASVEVAKSM